MSDTIFLPMTNGTLALYRLMGIPPEKPAQPPKFNRIAYAAAHIVSQPLYDKAPWQHSHSHNIIDWEATLAFRHHLWNYGFKIAEAMDTAQRGMGLEWGNTQELIRLVLSDAKTRENADLACGAGSDHLVSDKIYSLDEIIAAYEQQCDFIEKHGGKIILMASRALAKTAKSPDDYIKLYTHLIKAAQDKVILHWLGEMFDPHLSGYWGSNNFADALVTVLDIIHANAQKIEGIKISLLDESKEIALRQALPSGVKCFTGDDFNYTQMIKGDGKTYSHALLGIFDAIAPQAARALNALNAGDEQEFSAILAPTVALSRAIFTAPTQYYKAGIIFLAWLNGHQNHFTMLGGMQSARNIIHYADIFRLADQANLLEKPDLALQRMKIMLQLNGIEA